MNFLIKLIEILFVQSLQEPAKIDESIRLISICVIRSELQSINIVGKCVSITSQRSNPLIGKTYSGMVLADLNEDNLQIPIQFEGDAVQTANYLITGCTYLLERVDVVKVRLNNRRVPKIYINDPEKIKLIEVRV